MKLLLIPLLPFILTTDMLFRGDVLISEVLFNPRAGGTDFVEIYNRSAKTIDLRDLFIGSVTRDRRISNVMPITAEQIRFYPDTYLVLSTRPDLVQTHYPDAVEKAMVTVGKLPNLNNNEGTVILFYRETAAHGENDYRVLDSFHYAASMHSAFLKDLKGISLERQDLRTEANVPGNFSSAALSTGGATPGYRNSTALLGENEISLKSRVVSPDQDGLNDELELHYTFSRQHLMATIRIYDARGRPVRTLMQHMSIPSRGLWKWEGTTDQHQPVKEGIFTIYIELYDDRGFRQTYRKSFVIVRRK